VSEETNEALVDALAKPRFELMPVEGARERAVHLPKEAKVAITCSPTKGIESTLLLGEKLSERGFRIVPHISARLVADRAHLEEIVWRLDDLDVEEIFVIGGDARKPDGPFSSAFELLSAMADSGRGFEHAGIGGYPEGHPVIDDDTLHRALLDKQPFATYIVSQMCFDAGAILDWVADIRQGGIELPVYVGVPGVVERKRLLQISLKIGVGDSARFLTKYTNVLTRLFKPGGYRPDELVEKLAPYVGDRDYNIAGFHIYTFNQVESTEKWRQQMLSPDKEPAEDEVVQR
jgi:methylenetetrahydrofolate reductase (NADPH)